MPDRLRYSSPSVLRNPPIPCLHTQDYEPKKYMCIKFIRHEKNVWPYEQCPTGTRTGPNSVLKIIRQRVLPNISGKPGNTHEYPEIPQSKKNTRSYIQNSYPTQPEPDLLPIFFQYQTRPDCMIFISVYKNTNLKINGSRNDIACFLPLVQASVSFRSSVFFPRGYKNIYFHSQHRLIFR